MLALANDAGKSGSGSACTHRLDRQFTSLNNLSELMTELAIELSSLGTVHFVHSEHGRSTRETGLMFVLRAGVHVCV